jgi:hypothetical protein
MDLVAREFVPVYYHNALLIVVLVLIVTARDMVGVFGLSACNPMMQHADDGMEEDIIQEMGR